MDINEIRQYPHKIKQIDITNNNDISKSDYKTAMFKYTINDKNDNEIIVFSTDDALLNVIPSKKNVNDYYLSIPNIQGLSTIYAHYLMADLYDYEEDESDNDIFVSYDLSQLQSISTVKDYKVSADAKPKIASLIYTPDQNGYEEKDPNYKNYTNKKKDNKDYPLQRKEYFPLVSRYNTNGKDKQLTAPKVGDQEVDAKWKIEKSNNGTPEWEVHIPRKDLKIVKEDTNEINPINVYLNYQYLPSSTKYHQHFFGFEDKERTKSRNINVLDGDDLNIVNTNFGDEGTYRLINWYNKTDTTNKMYVPHNVQTAINMDNAIIHDESCSFDKNTCDDYYIYTAEKDADDYGLHMDLTLKKDTDYILKYYMWVPNNIDTDRDEMCVTIRCPNEFDTGSEIIGILKEYFRVQDRFLTQQWIYHEIPFSTTKTHNQIYIKGPKYNPSKGQVIFFTDFVLEEIVPYSPTIKYTNKGVFVMEGTADPISKPNKEHKIKNLFPNDGEIEDYQENVDKLVSNGIDIEIEKLPTPHTHVYIDFDDSFDIEYSNNTSLLTYTQADCIINYYREDIYNDENEKIHSEYDLEYESDDVTFTYYTEDIFNENNEKIHSAYDLEVNYVIKKLFTNGINNSFTLKLHNEDGAPMTKGDVECCITTSTTEDKCVKYLGKKQINAEGIVLYDELDFSILNLNTQYYLQIKYTNNCYKNPIIKYKKIYLKAEEPMLTLFAKKGEAERSIIEENKLTLTSALDFPLQIDAEVIDVNTGNPLTEGYCELSIDDEVTYTTLVDDGHTADFYLNKDKLKNGTNIKITYYNKKKDNKGGYFKVLAYDYFNIEIDNDFNTKPIVPIRYKILINDRIQQDINNINSPFKINADDCLLIDLDTSDEEFINYSIRVYRNETPIKINGDEIYINITSHSDDSIVISDFLDNDITENTIVKYTIVTDNKRNNENTFANNKYTEYKKSFYVEWVKEA